MGLLEMSLHLINAVLQLQDLLEMLLAVMGEHVHGVSHDPYNLVHHFSQLLLGRRTELDILLPALNGCVCHILRMVSDSLNIVHHMEKAADALDIINGQRALVDGDQIIRDGVVHIINMFFHPVDLCDLLLIHCDQRIHRSV